MESLPQLGSVLQGMQGQHPNGALTELVLNRLGKDIAGRKVQMKRERMGDQRVPHRQQPSNTQKNEFEVRKETIIFGT